MSALDFAHDIAAVAPLVGLEPVKPTTYRVLDLNERRPVATGLTFWEAHAFIDREKRNRPQARFDIRTEF